MSALRPVSANFAGRQFIHSRTSRSRRTYARGVILAEDHTIQLPCKAVDGGRGTRTRTLASEIVDRSSIEEERRRLAGGRDGTGRRIARGRSQSFAPLFKPPTQSPPPARSVTPHSSRRDLYTSSTNSSKTLRALSTTTFTGLVPRPHQSSLLLLQAICTPPAYVYKFIQDTYCAFARQFSKPKHGRLGTWCLLPTVGGYVRIKSSRATMGRWMYKYRIGGHRSALHRHWHPSAHQPQFELARALHAPVSHCSRGRFSARTVAPMDVVAYIPSSPSVAITSHPTVRLLKRPSSLPSYVRVLYGHSSSRRSHRCLAAGLAL
ncbi:hypothetical protein R3P38DRAFT_2809486 [Favolaschia claudopus]|uniref:Uncharacterized protein n=1 Tax=Favolaschia claudopus TaxID=2862362 RepID=A0AAV9ZCG0_9AGAR